MRRVAGLVEPRLRAGSTLPCLSAASAKPLIFACSADHDLLRVASENRMDVKRFEAYGTAETPLIQANGDAACDLLLLPDEAVALKGG